VAETFKGKLVYSPIKLVTLEGPYSSFTVKDLWVHKSREFLDQLKLLSTFQGIGYPTPFS
jgi:hypothetical protein